MENKQPNHHIFFQQFGINPNGEIQIPIDPTYAHNTMIMEIYNNWPFCRWLMFRYKEGVLKQVDQVENEWLNFIMKNNLDLEKYEKDCDSFLKENIKSINE